MPACRHLNFAGGRESDAWAGLLIRLIPGPIAASPTTRRATAVIPANFIAVLICRESVQGGVRLLDRPSREVFQSRGRADSRQD
jgi:hypothetical protein